SRALPDPGCADRAGAGVRRPRAHGPDPDAQQRPAGAAGSVHLPDRRRGRAARRRPAPGRGAGDGTLARPETGVWGRGTEPDALGARATDVPRPAEAGAAGRGTLADRE